MILLIDNYDSFTYNLFQYFSEMSKNIRVFRNDKIDVAAMERLKPTHLVISPGPGTPKDGGVSMDAVRHFAGRIPILGVCLGHQCIAEVFGGRVVRAKRLMHGKVSQIRHDGRTVFRGVPNPFIATRYHSLIAEPKSIPTVLHVSARTAEGEIMGLRHKKFKVEGVQFHPESILTDEGKKILKNFLDL